jgi:hypothetical protein
MSDSLIIHHRTARIGVVILRTPLEIEVAVHGSLELKENLRLLPGLYEVRSGEHSGGAYANVEALLPASGRHCEHRVGFGLNDTCTAFVSSTLRQGADPGPAVILDPGIHIASFFFAPGRVGYRVEHTDGKPLEYVERA